MIFTVSEISKSLADYLFPYFSNVTFYENPNQQGTKLPCMFLQQRYSNIEPRMDGRYLRKIGLDITYLIDYNLSDMQMQYENAAETLDLLMSVFPYRNGNAEALVRTYDREWNIDLDALHYKFEIREIVAIPKKYEKMNKIQEFNEEVTADAER